MDRAELERLDRESLVLRAQASGIRRARVLTRPELVDELLRLDPTIDEDKLRRTRGFFGRARDLLSRVVERGLHLPDAAERLVTALGTTAPDVRRPEPQAVPTVTLAEIYAAQGHKQRAIETLQRVLDREPDHNAARALLERLGAADYVSPPPPLPPEPEVEPARAIEADDDEEPETPRQSVLPPPAQAPEPEEDVEEEAALTLRRDECIAIPLAGGATYVCWRLSPTTLNAHPDKLVVRAVLVVPSWEGPTVETRDTEVMAADGDCVLRNAPERAVVRVAIGWREDDGFVPVAHSPAFERSARGGLACWTLEGAAPVVLDDPRAASIARAYFRAGSAELR